MTGMLIIRGIVAVVAVLIALGLVFIALKSAVAFVHVDGREGLGNAGYLFVTLFFLVLAGPFAAIAALVGLPLISDDPKFRPGKQF